MNTMQAAYDDAFNKYCNALAWGHLGEALQAADELCRPRYAKIAVDLLPLPAAGEAFSKVPAVQLQGITDRIEQHNSRVEDR